MKTREGFVSNSSSTSFVVVLPDNVITVTTNDVAKLDADLVGEVGGPEAAVKQLNEVLKTLKTNEILGQDEYESGTFYLLAELLNKYIVAEVPTSSDGGMIIVANRQKVKKVLG
jgi:hypothetical protein